MLVLGVGLLQGSVKSLEPRRLLDDVLPNAEDTYALRSEFAAVAVIASPVPIDFGVPEFPPRCWAVASAFGAGMPEASVDKEGEFCFWKVEVRAPQNVLLVFAPPRDLSCSEHDGDGGFGGLVPFALNLCHDCGARGTREGVHRLIPRGVFVS